MKINPAPAVYDNAAVAAAQLALDQADVDAVKAQVIRPADGGPASVLGVVGTFDLDAAETAAAELQLIADCQAVAAVQAFIVRPEDGGPEGVLTVVGTFDVAAITAADAAAYNAIIGAVLVGNIPAIAGASEGTYVPVAASNVKTGVTFGAVSAETGTMPYGLPATRKVSSIRNGDDGDIQAGLKAGATPTAVRIGGTYPSGTPRFVDNGDGTATDQATGLTWVKAPLGLGAGFNAKVAWGTAIDGCLALTYANKTDWRLPNLFELLSIMNTTVAAAPLVDALLTPASDSYWTSTLCGSWSGGSYAHTLSFATSLTNYTGPAGASGYAWPVRGGVINGVDR